MAIRKDRFGRVVRRRRCDRCGHVAWLPERRRRCYRPRFGRGSYACYGNLLPVVRPAKATTREAVMAMAAMADEPDALAETGRRRVRPQDVAAKKAAHARKMVTVAARKVTAATRSLALWQRRVREYDRRAAMTDAEVEAASKKVRESFERSRKRNVRRGISLDGDIVR